MMKHYKDNEILRKAAFVKWFLILLLCYPLSLKAQEEGSTGTTYEPIVITTNPDAMLTMHWAMPTLLNPAATGDIDFIRIRGGARLDWLGSHQSPKNFLGAVDAPFKLMGKRIGAGIIVNSESHDLFRNLLIEAQGSYKFQFKKSKLSIGIQIGYYHSKYKGSELILSNTPEGGVNGDILAGTNGNLVRDSEDTPGDTGETDNTENEETPSNPFDTDMPTQDVAGGGVDLAVGIRYEHPKFHVGISGQHLTNTKLRLSTEGESSSDSRYIESKLPITLYFDAGGNIPIHNSLFTLQPSLLAGTDFKDFTTVVEMRATYDQKITFGVDYRYNRAVGIMAGLSLKNFFIGYSWEYDYSASPRGSTGNHELVLGYQLKLDMGGKNLFSHRSIRIM